MGKRIAAPGVTFSMTVQFLIAGAPLQLTMRAPKPENETDR